MSEVITTPGGSDRSVLVTVDGADAVKLAEQFRDELVGYRDSNSMQFSTLSSDGTSTVSGSGQLLDDVITQGGQYNIGNGANYAVIGQVVDNSTLGKVPAQLLTSPVTINSSMSAGQFIKVLAGNLIDSTDQPGVTYNAGQENGSFVGGSVRNPIRFVGNDNNGGNWNVVTGGGNDVIYSGSGNDTINAGSGQNTINLGSGNNSVESNGQDTITSPFNGGFNTITLKGGNSTVNVGINSVVNDVSANNTITVGGGSTVIGGTDGTVNFNSVNNGNLNMFIGGDSNTVTATADNFHIIHGASNNFNVTGDFRYFNGVGDTYATITGSNQLDIKGNKLVNTQIFGANGLDFHLNAHDNVDSVMFVSGITGANQTLDGSTSTSNLMIYADTTPGATNSRLLGIGGSGDDTLVGGSGFSTLTGGTGNNWFLFTNKEDDGGNTVITDFSKSTGNKIEFLNYGLDNKSLLDILNNAHNDDQGNAVLNLGNHQLTLQGVSKESLNITQFTYYNQPAK